MKLIKLLCLVALLSLSKGAVAQQGAQYTQFNFDKLWFNPGYAGNHGAPAVQAIIRQQWIGFGGAPASQSFAFHLPMYNDRVGLGLMLDRDALGPVESFNITAAYAFRVPMGNGTLSLGLQASMNSFNLDFNSLTTITPDFALVDVDGSRLAPNFGAGAFFRNEKSFFGASIPSLLRNDIQYSFNIENTVLLPVNMYITGGRVFELTDKLDLQPSFLMRYAPNTPLDLDLHFSFIFINRLYSGVSYRLGGNGNGESLDFVFQYQLVNGLKIGAAYDYTLSQLQQHNDGSVEVMMQYVIKPRPKSRTEQITNPRFF